MITDFVNGADVRVIERGSSPCFAPEAFQCLAIVGHFVGQELESDEAAKIGVFAFEDNAHAASAELLEDAVVGNSGVDHAEETKCWLMLGRNAQGSQSEEQLLVASC